MLLSLSIKNFALIDKLEFNPCMGLNVITGETGAGKSLLVDALGALTGKRVGRGVVRTGAQQAWIEAVFDSASLVMEDEIYDQYGIEKDEDDQIILSRLMSAEGRSVVRINSKIVPLSALKEIGPRFIDIHGQHDQQAIFSVSHHIELLDRFSGDMIFDLIKEYKRILLNYKECISKIKNLGLDPDAKERRLDMLRFQIDEIRSIDVKEGEEEKLLSDRKQARLREKSAWHLQQIEQLFDVESQTSAIVQLQKASESFEFFTAVDSSFDSVNDRYRSIMTELADIEKAMHDLYSDISSLTMSSDKIDQRLDQIYRLKDKYGPLVSDIKEYLNGAEQEIEYLESSEKRLKSLHVERISLEKTLLKHADSISLIRKEAAEKMSSDIQATLSDLGMPHAVFTVDFQTRPKSKFFSSKGYDLVSFKFSANPGEPPMPLEKIASGGEASRIMLAIKTILSTADQTHTLVFDEIDSGISGDTATKVAEKLRLLSDHKQVLCVTHTAQIAAMSNTHFYISKAVVDQRTSTHISNMTEDQRIKEVARLLSGESDDIKSVALSEQLISRRGDLKG